VCTCLRMGCWREKAGRQAGRQAEHELTDYPHRDGMLLWMRF